MTDRRCHRGQSGASLMIVLGLVTVMGVLIPALLTIAGTGLLITSPIVKDRAEVYAATSGIEAAIAHGRIDESVGAPGVDCRAQLLTISDFEVTIDCEGTPISEDDCVSSDRFVTYTAEVRSPGESEVLIRSSAEVAYRHQVGGSPLVDVRQFTSYANGPVTTVKPCQGTTPATTTTTTSTTTTTTTVPPSSTTTSTTSTSTSTTTTTAVPVAVLATWNSPAKEVPPATSKNRWRALASAQIKDMKNKTVAGAEVTVEVRYRQKNDAAGTWRTDPDQLVGTTGNDGSVPFASKEYASNGQRVDQVQFVVLNVKRSGFKWDSPTPEVSITINR